AKELLQMAGPTVEGLAKGSWSEFQPIDPKTRADILRLWDESTETMNQYWPTIPTERFHEMTKAFGQYEGRTNDLVMYVIDNEVHHRGQGYVYLRALGIEPPPFWERQ
ncbi:MAG: DinB family protein, partial [Gemmatimonadaceae bacterium]